MKKIENRKSRKEFLIVLIIVILNINLLISQNQEEKIKLNSYLNDEKLPELVNADSATKQELWESERSITIKNSAAEDIANFLAQKRIEGEKLARGSIALGDALFKSIFPNVDEIDLSIKGIDLKVALNYKGGLAGFLRDNGYDISEDLVNPKIESFSGFENLKWSDKGKNIIGDGKVFLDLERIPLGTKKVEYRDGKFILHRYDGSKIIISKTDEEGNVVLKNTGIKDKDGKQEFIKINPFDIMVTGNKGEVELTDEGFLLMGDGEVIWKGMSFRKIEDSDEGVVRILGDRFVLNNAYIHVKGLGYISPKNQEDFVFYVGDTRRYLGLESLLDKDFKMYDVSELDGIVRTASFQDFGYTNIEGTIGVSPSFQRKEYLDVELRFDSSGNLRWIKREDISNGAWIPTETGHVDLKKIYDKSSPFVRSLIDRIQKGERVSYDDVRKGFYENPDLKSGGREIKINSYQENFAAIIGNNLAVGGSGRIILERDLNSLTSIDAEEFDFKIGDFLMRFKGNKLYYPNAPVKESFSIDDITLVSKGRAGKSYQIIKEDNGLFKVKENERLVAGRLIGLGPFGSSAEVSIDFDSKDLKDIKEEVEGAWWSDKEALIETAKEKNFRVNLGFKTPLEPISVVSELLPEAVKKEADAWIGNVEKRFNIQLRQDVKDKFKRIILTSVGSLQKDIKLSDVSFVVENNPSGGPRLITLVKEKEIGRTEFTGSDAQMIRDLIIELSLRVPDFSKGTTATHLGIIKKNVYWPGSQLKFLWEDVFGRSTRYGQWSDKKYRDNLLEKYGIDIFEF